MLTGLSAGITWALETVVLAAALGMISSDSLPQAALLPLAATFLHDAFSALYMFAYNTVRGNLKKLPEVVRSGFKKAVKIPAVFLLGAAGLFLIASAVRMLVSV